MRRPSYSLLLAAMLFASSPLASAQEPAGAPASSGTSGESAPAAEGGGGGRFAPPPQGLSLSAGLQEWGAYFGRPYFRAEVDIPLSRGLSLQLPFMVSRWSYGYYDPFIGSSYDESITSLAIVPGVQNEWSVFEWNGHHLVVAVEGGAGIVINFWNYPNDPAYPNNDTWIGGVIRAAAPFRIVTNFGLIASVAPVGFALLFGEGGAEGAYDFSAMVGYRFK